MTVIIYGRMRQKGFHLLGPETEFWYLEDVTMNKFAKIRFGFRKRIIVILMLLI